MRLRRPTVLAGAALLALMVASVVAIRGKILFTWPLWLDEYHTVFLAERGSFQSSLTDLASGADFNPPLLYAIERLISHATGGLSPVSLRVTSFISVWLALVLVFSALRRILPDSAAFVGALAVWTNATVIEHTFEGRFYGPWLLSCALLLWSIGIDWERERSRKREVFVLVSSVLVCTIHWFGIISLVLIAIGWMIVIGTAKQKYRRLLPMIAGPISLIACTPILLGQRSALSVSTWVPPLSLQQVREMLQNYLVAPTMLLAVMLVVLRFALRNIRRGPATQAGKTVSDALPFLVLLAMPLIIMAISAFVQPSMVTRYAIVAALAWAPLIALGVRPMPGFAKAIVAAALLSLSLKTVSARAQEVDKIRRAVEFERKAAARFAASGKTLLVPTRHSLYPLAAPQLDNRAFLYPDFSDSTARAREFPNALIVERDAARAHYRRYGFPRLLAVDDTTQTTELLFLLPLYGTMSSLHFLFPHHEATLIAPQVYSLRAAADWQRSEDQFRRASELIYRRRDAASAIPLLDSLLERVPNHYRGLWLRADALESRKLFPEAIVAWHAVINEAEVYGYRTGLSVARRRYAHLVCDEAPDAVKISLIRRLVLCPGRRLLPDL